MSPGFRGLKPIRAKLANHRAWRFRRARTSAAHDVEAALACVRGTVASEALSSDDGRGCVARMKPTSVPTSQTEQVRVRPHSRSYCLGATRM